MLTERMLFVKNMTSSKLFLLSGGLMTLSGLLMVLSGRIAVGCCFLASAACLFVAGFNSRITEKKAEEEDG